MISKTMLYGMKDDSIAGRDIKLTMKVKGGAWFIESVEERQRCARGVDSSGDLCI